MIGTVTRLLLNKGFGFARGEDGESYFVHAKDFVNVADFDSLYEGQRLEFTPGLSQANKGNGRRALEITCSPSNDR